MQSSLQKSIFKKGSKTYYYSSFFFPKKVLEKITILYAFVRTADDFVDQIPQDEKGFFEFKKSFNLARQNKKTGDPIVDDFAKLENELGFDKTWADSFLDSMQMDLEVREYQTLQDTLDYIYGSAEVIGLFLAKILGLDTKSYTQAKLLGRSMQYINFIRDINEDVSLSRNYFPKDEMDEFGLLDLKKQTITDNYERFVPFLKVQLDRYKAWQDEAETGFRFIPKNYLVPIKTASDMYNWTAKKISSNPMLIYKYKVKPSKARIILTGVRNWLRF